MIDHGPPPTVTIAEAVTSPAKRRERDEQLAAWCGLDEAQTAAAILGYNYQSSPFYDDTFRLLKGRGLNPEVTGDGWLAAIYRQMVKGEWL